MRKLLFSNAKNNLKSCNKLYITVYYIHKRKNCPRGVNSFRFFLVQTPTKVMNNVNTINNEDDQVLVFNQLQLYTDIDFIVKQFIVK